MKYTLWLCAFICLCTAAVTGLGVGSKALAPEWFCVTLLAIVAMFSCIEFTKE